MRILVLIAGVHDPKWPVSADAVQENGAPDDHRIMSPFDEAALEMALRIRDKHDGASLVVRVAGGQAGLRIARAAAALSVDDIACFAVGRPWDQQAVATALAPLCDGADLVLTGREFGDMDDGLVPPMLAARCGMAFFGRAQVVEIKTLATFQRELGAESQSFVLNRPALVSVTNDRRTRLRKPLMKNVMMARQAKIAQFTLPVRPGRQLSLVGVKGAAGGRGSTDCAFIGGAVAEQAAALAALLDGIRA